MFPLLLLLPGLPLPVPPPLLPGLLEPLLLLLFGGGDDEPDGPPGCAFGCGINACLATLLSPIGGGAERALTCTQDTFHYF